MNVCIDASTCLPHASPPVCRPPTPHAFLYISLVISLSLSLQIRHTNPNLANNPRSGWTGQLTQSVPPARRDSQQTAASNVKHYSRLSLPLWFGLIWLDLILILLRLGLSTLALDSRHSLPVDWWPGYYPSCQLPNHCHDPSSRLSFTSFASFSSPTHHPPYPRIQQLSTSNSPGRGTQRKTTQAVYRIPRSRTVPGMSQVVSDRIDDGRHPGAKGALMSKRSCIASLGGTPGRVRCPWPLPCPLCCLVH